MKSNTAYENFIAQKNINFSNFIKNYIGNEAVIKAYRIFDSFELFLAETQQFKKHEIVDNYKTIPIFLSDSELECYTHLQTYYASRERDVDVSSTPNKGSTFRFIDINSTFPPLENDCKKLNDHYNQHSGEKRYLKKTIQVVYAKKSSIHQNYSLQFENHLEQACGSCQKWMTTAHKLLNCAKCHKIYYCNKGCQKTDWKAHKINCTKKDF